MEREYKIAFGWKLFMLIGSPPLCALFAWMAWMVMVKEPFDLTLTLIMLPLSIGLIIMFVFGLIDMFFAKLVISRDRLKKANIWGTKELLFDEIKGFQSDKNHIYIIPKSENKKWLKISKYYDNKAEWKSFIEHNFKDLDVQFYLDEVKEFREDKAFGLTETEKEENLRRTKKLTRILNYISCGAVLWYLINPDPYALLTAINLLLPVLGLVIVYREKGRIKVIKTENSPYPSLTATLSLPPIAIMIRTYLDFNVMDFTKAWIYVVLITPFIFFFLLKSSRKEFKVSNKIEALIIYPFLMVTIGLFVFFGSVMLNCAYDKSEPTIFETIVLKKRISDGKNLTRYILSIPARERADEELEVSVSRRQYESIGVNEKINVYEQEGLLKIPWLFVSNY